MTNQQILELLRNDYRIFRELAIAKINGEPTEELEKEMFESEKALEKEAEIVGKQHIMFLTLEVAEEQIYKQRYRSN